MSQFFDYGMDSYGSLDALGGVLLREAESLAREKGLPYDGVLKCLEKAFDDIIRRFYGFRELVVRLDVKNGTLRVYRPIFPEAPTHENHEKPTHHEENSPENKDISHGEPSEFLGQYENNNISQGETPEFQEHHEESFSSHEEENSLENTSSSWGYGEKKESIVHQETQGTQEPSLEMLPVPPFNRVAIQHLKKALLAHIQDLERDMSYEEFQRRLGQVVSCVVKHVDRGNLFVDIGRTEAMIPRSELIPQESFGINDRLKAYIFNVKRQQKGPQVFLSRAHPGFLGALLTKEVPEIQEGLVEIKSIARDPGSRGKIAIYSLEGKSLDAVGACVGVRGSRISAVSKELGGEKIDIIPWSEDNVVFVVNALVPAEVNKVIVEKSGRYKVIVSDSQKGIAIGARGWNVRLAHQLTKVNIDIVTESAHQQQRTELRDYLVKIFVQHLNVDELMAHFLVSEGFESIEDIVNTSLEELESLDGLDKDIAMELKERAEEALQEVQEEEKNIYESSGGQKDLLELELPSWTLPIFARQGILSLQDFGDLAQDELKDILGENNYKKLEDNQWSDFILKARQSLYDL